MTRLIFFNSKWYVSHPHPFLDLVKKYPTVHKYMLKGLQYVPSEELLLTRLCYHDVQETWTWKTVLKATFEPKPMIPSLMIIYGQHRPDIRGLLGRRDYYRRWYYLSYLGIPVSLLFTVVPGPNVVLLYNLFRLYSYKHAMDGLGLIERADVVYKQDVALDNMAMDDVENKYDLKYLLNGQLLICLCLVIVVISLNVAP